ncbi:MAG TPA: hypothetical protein VGI10_11895, partial [Polyangiaceae bacterium]
SSNPSGGAGANGPCVSIVSLGQPGNYGDNQNDSTTAFQTWLQSKSNAVLQMDTTPTTITADFLAQYQVVVIQGLMDNVKSPTTFWQPTPDEASALQTWVEAGGGLISMTGYTGAVQEVTPVNTLLSFTNIQYNMDDIFQNCDNAVYMNHCYCWGSSVPFTGFVQSTPIGANITQVGIFHGRSIQAPSDATIVAKDAATGAVLGVTKQIGMGRVFVFADEWVTYTSQWAGSSSTQSDMTCTSAGLTGDKYFQVPQFWYNSFKWVSQRTCFDIMDMSIVK